MQIFQMFSYFTYKIQEKNTFVNITTEFIRNIFKYWGAVKLTKSDTSFQNSNFFLKTQILSVATNTRSYFL